MEKILSLITLLGLSVSGALAHGDDSHVVNDQDVTIKTTKAGGNVFMLQGRGGNIGALVGPEGIVLVDDDYKNVSEKLAAALRSLGSERPRLVLNTHWHADHTEGNFFFGKDAIIVAHANVRKRMMDPPVIFGQKTPPYPALALPIVTYKESLSLFLNGEEIRAVHYPNGHTDGDTVVFFTGSNVVHMGDDFFMGAFPFVDLDSGGSVQGLINNISALVKEIPANAKIIPGHGGLATLSDLQEFLAMLNETSAFVQDAMKKGAPLDDIKKAGLPGKYASWGKGFIKTEMWIETIHASYARK